MHPRFIALSAPGFIPNESSQWEVLFKAGLLKLHVRKPGMNTKQISDLIKKVPEEYHSRVILHGCPELLSEFKVAGYHGKPEEREGLKLSEGQSFSISVHSWREVEDHIDKVDYLFLSPVFDSISKEGYMANPDLMYFPKYLKGKKIYALGGVTALNWEDALDFGYHGVAVLGSLWEKTGIVWNEFSKFKLRGEEIGWEG